MPDYKSIHTGSQIDDAVTKAQNLPAPGAGNANKVMGFDLDGNLAVTDVPYTSTTVLFNGNAIVEEIGK